MKSILIGCLALISAMACATTTLSSDRLSSSTSAIRAAEELGARSVPQAALHLKLAEEQLAQAKKYAESGDATRAELYVQRSIADADLAVTLTRQRAANDEADKAQKATMAFEEGAK